MFYPMLPPVFRSFFAHGACIFKVSFGELTRHTLTCGPKLCIAAGLPHLLSSPPSVIVRETPEGSSGPLLLGSLFFRSPDSFGQ